MAIFDKAFGKRPGITGSEKLTELAGHWFGGEAQKAIVAAKAPESGRCVRILAPHLLFILFEGKIMIKHLLRYMKSHV